MIRKVLIVVITVLALALATGAYEQWIVMRHADRGRLAGLVVTAPPPGFTKKASASNEVTAASSPFSAFKTAAKNAPGSTGAWTSSWTSPSSSSESATVLVSLLPSAAIAAQVEAQAETQFLGTGAFAAQSYTRSASAPVPGVPGAKGAVFRPKAGAASPPVTTAVYRYGRAQVLVIVGKTGTPTQAEWATAALATSEFAHLRGALSSFSFLVTTVPLVATLVFWAVVVGGLGLALGIPMGSRRARRRRDQARSRLAARQHQVRGSKIARRQAVRRR